MSDAPRVLCVGLSCLDLVWRVATFPPVTSRTEATDHTRHGGGPAATAAVAAARFGARTSLWAVHGHDEAGRQLSDELRGYGVEVEHVRVPEGATSFVSAVLVGPDGERWIFRYRGEGLDDDPSAFPIETVASYDAVLCDLRHPRLSSAVLAAAREAGVPSVVDLGTLRDLHLVGDASVVIAAREAGEQALAGASDRRAGASGRDAAIEEALELLRARPEQIVAVTLGDEGVVYDVGDGLRHLSAFPVGEVVDTTGAGDVFHGTWTAALASGADADACARFASVAAALSCTASGRAAIPDGDTVRELLEERTVREMNEMEWA